MNNHERTTPAALEKLESRQFLAAGDLVGSFGRGGVLDFANLRAASELLVQKSGKILVSSGDTIYRFRANGRLDRSFGRRGRLNLGRYITDMALDASDRILVPVPGGRWGFSRYTANGAPDTTLNGSGTVSTQIGDDDHWESATFIGVAPDGKIVLGGTQDNDNDDPDLWDFQKPHDVAVARFNPNGAVDTTFGGTGEHWTRRFENLNAFAVGPQGNALVAGLFIRGSMNRGGAYEEIGANGVVVSGTDTSAVSGVGSDNFSAGYRADGARLIGAGSYGWASVWQGDDSEVVHFNATDRDQAQDSVVRDLAAAGSGNKVYAAGYAGGMSAGAGSGLMRLNPNGDLDATFGFGGTVAYDLFRGHPEWLDHVVVLPGGDILAAGRRGWSSVYDPGDSGSLFLAKFEGGSLTVGRQRPRAGVQLFAPRAGGTETRFEVAYAAEQSINRSTIDNRDIVVVGPRGHRQFARLVDVTDRRDGRAVIATYAITAPGGTWDNADAGTYQVVLRRRAVRDNFGNAAAAGTVASFDFPGAGAASSSPASAVVSRAANSPLSTTHKVEEDDSLFDPLC